MRNDRCRCFWIAMAIMAAIPEIVGAQEVEEDAARTELCSYVLGAEDALTGIEQEQRAAERTDDFTGKDVRCLRAGGAADSVLHAATTARRERTARAIQAVGEGVQVATEVAVVAKEAVEEQAATAESKPMDLWVLVRNPTKLAIAEEGGFMVFLNELGSDLGMTESTEIKVYDEIVHQTQENFDSAGVEVRVSHAVHQVGRRGGSVWAKGDRKHVAVEAGDSRLMRITVLDPIGIARSEKGDLMVGAGLMLGKDIDGEVREAVEQRVFRRLRANGVDAVIVARAR